MNELELVMSLRDEVPLAKASPAVENAVLAAIGETAPKQPRNVGASLSPGQQQGAHVARRLGAPGRCRARVPPGSATGRRRGLAGGRAARLAGMRIAAVMPQGRGLRVALACAVAMAVGAASVLSLAAPQAPDGAQLIPWSGRPTALSQSPGHPSPGHPSLGQARTEAQLVDYATRVAAAAPGRAPGPHEWVFTKTEIAGSTHGSGGWLFGPPDQRLIALGWTRVDWRETTGMNVPADLPADKVVHRHLRLVPEGGGTLGGWRSVRYSYLNSLPTDPARLKSIILADNNPRMPWYSTPDNMAIFNAIANLLRGETDGVWIPPKLAATMYRVLQQLPGVHFDGGTDLAGRTGIGLYMVIDGWYKRELVIDPVTYTYMGDKIVAVTARTMVGTDGIRHIENGQVLDWAALLESAIVRHPGQLP